MTLKDPTPIKEYEEIKFDFFEGIARITINRPHTAMPLPRIPSLK